MCAALYFLQGALNLETVDLQAIRLVLVIFMVCEMRCQVTMCCIGILCQVGCVL
jgi:hypothetical protein